MDGKYNCPNMSAECPYLGIVLLSYERFFIFIASNAIKLAII